MNTDTNTIPNIAEKIKALSPLKQKYTIYIVQLFDLFDNAPSLKIYAIPLIHLLQKIINIHNDVVLKELEDALSSVLITYIFDLTDLLNGDLDLNKYEPHHKNLLAIHANVNAQLSNYEPYIMLQLKNMLYLV